MKKYFILVITIAFFACTNRSKVPEYVIPQQDMVDIFVDIHLMDGLMTANRIRQKMIKKDSLNYYDIIFEKYGITQNDFDTSLQFYSRNINKYDKIYEQVLNKLTEIEAKLKEESLEQIK